jgi:hypothetical protein
MTLERARGHDGWRARRPDLSQPSQAERSTNSASAPRHERRMRRRPGASAVATPTSTGQRRSAHRRGQRNRCGKRRRCTSRSQSGGPQPTGDCERDRPLVSPSARAGGRRWHLLCARKAHRDQCRSRPGSRPPSEAGRDLKCGSLPCSSPNPRLSGRRSTAAAGSTRSHWLRVQSDDRSVANALASRRAAIA